MALGAARGGNFERIVCVFQPHRYSRVATLAPEFADAFEGADLVVVTEVYPAGELPRPGVSGKLVLDAIVSGPPRGSGRLRAGAVRTSSPTCARSCARATCASPSRRAT